jgi:hypothetical protein
MVHPLAGHGGDLEQLVSCLGQRLYSRKQQVPQHLRQLGGFAGSLDAGGQQLLGEGGIAFRAGQDFADKRSGGRLAADPRQQLAQLAAAQAAQFEPFGPAAAVQLCKERPQRVAAVQLI